MFTNNAKFKKDVDLYLRVQSYHYAIFNATFSKKKTSINKIKIIFLNLEKQTKAIDDIIFKPIEIFNFDILLFTLKRIFPNTKL